MKKINVILAAVLSSALSFGIIGGAVLSASAAKTEGEPTVTTEAAVSAEASPAVNVKDETVYVLAQADGTVDKIIVSDWLKNTLKSDRITDVTDLKNVQNVKGDETYTSSGNGKVWDANGNDVYYQGNIEKEVPVSLSVSYKLDGKTVSPREILGKSGKVTIRYDYENKQYRTVIMDGKEEKIYVPFAMLTGILMDNDVFTNVEVSNGKRINDGNRTAVVGFAFPGLQENLAIDKEKFEIPDYVEITADAKNFKLGMTVTVAVNNIFGKLSLPTDSLEELNGSLGEMSDAMSQLLDGSSKLYGGLNTLLEKSDALVSGINRLAEGAAAAKTGAEQVKNGAADVSNGAKSLSDGLNTLTDNNLTLNGGATQVFNTLLATAQTQIAAAGLDVPTMTIENYATVLNGVIASLDETVVYNQALEQVTAAVKENVTNQVTAGVQAQVKAQVTAGVRENVAAQVIYSATNMDKATYDAAVAGGAVTEEQQEQINAAIEAQMESDAVKATITQTVNEKMESDAVKATITQTVNEKMESDAVKAVIQSNMQGEEVQTKLAAAAIGRQSLVDLKASLDSYNTFYVGLQTYTAGVAQAAEGADTLKTGAAELSQGASRLYVGISQLYDGIIELKDGTPALVSGITDLRDGALQLSDGLKEFDEKGVQKLIDAVDGDLNGLITRINATIDVAKSYKSFAGISEDMDGQVKFIYRTEGIE